MPEMLIDLAAEAVSTSKFVPEGEKQKGSRLNTFDKQAFPLVALVMSTVLCVTTEGRNLLIVGCLGRERKDSARSHQLCGRAPSLT